MDVKELNKKQLILLTLLITFVVSIATGIVTVSLMNQMPKSIPQTINNVIQRTIEKVTTVEVPSKTVTKVETKENDNSIFLSNKDALVSIYSSITNLDSLIITTSTDNKKVEDNNAPNNEPLSVGQGIIISDIGLVLVDSSIIIETESYKTVLDKTIFDVSVLKKFGNGFTILKITPIEKVTETPSTSKNSQ